MTLQEFFQCHTAVAVAFSGGTDSAFLLAAAKQHGARVNAYYVKTPFQPQFEHEDALRLAWQLDVPMKTIEVDILALDAVTCNGKDRCYHCKQAILSAIRKAAEQDGFLTVVDGSNASDDPSDRPGMQAAEELQVLSPLRLCGLTKEAVRQRSRELGLFTHNKPAYACLATRIPTGTPITLPALQKTEAAEEYLKALGFSDFRIRLAGTAARVQVRQEQIPLAKEHWDAITKWLLQFYDTVLPPEVRA